MTETQLRFLRAIGERLPFDRVAELYLFPPMRQGIHESGIAVIAAVRDEPGTRDPEAGTRGADDAPDPTAPDASAEACDPTEDASRDASGDDAADVIESTPSAPEGTPGLAAPDPVALDAIATEPPPDVAAAGSRVPGPASRAPRPDPHTGTRHTVYTARYRLALKGPERGRWELNVVEEADAPLLTVEMVVRGVQQRSGEGADPERLEPAALRELLAAPAA